MGPSRALGRVLVTAPGPVGCSSWLFLFAVWCQTIPTDGKDFLHNPAAPESRNDAKPELCARASHISSQDGRGNLAHPGASKGTATPCPGPALLPPCGAGMGAAQLGRSQEMPNPCLSAGNHPAGRWLMVQRPWRGASRVLLGIWGFNGCSSCAFPGAGKALGSPPAPSAQPGHGTSSRLFNVPPLALTAQLQGCSPPTQKHPLDLVSPPRPQTLGPSPELAAPKQHFQPVGTSGRRIHGGNQQSGVENGAGNSQPCLEEPSRGKGTAPGVAEGHPGGAQTQGGV